MTPQKQNAILVRDTVAYPTIYDAIGELARCNAHDVDGWRPIETAPHNMSVLIYYKNELGKRRIVKASHCERWTVEANMDEDSYHEYSEEKDGYFMHEGWYEQIDNWPEYSSCFVNEGIPTHWMPLPTPPAMKGNDL